jgi:hypothetical protein
VRIACEAARNAKPAIKLGVCGEHAGHPASADFLVRLGIDSVSCSPFRVPMARLGVAQALLACGRVRINDVAFTFDADGSSAADRDASAPSTSEPGDDPSDAEIGVDEVLVLHTLRTRGFVTPDGFTQSIGIFPAEILARLVADGHVRYTEKRDLYSLLPAGTERHEALLDSYADEALRAGLAAPYGRFRELNEQFKQICTDWQLRNGSPNDHADSDYDSACAARLAALHESSRPVLDAMAAVLPRLDRYATRLDRAVEAVANGETKRFTGVMCDSYHDVWMELHEDLIVLQRIDRVEEGSF